MIAGADDVIDRLLVYVDFSAIETLLPAALIVFAVAGNHCDVSVGSFVIVRLAWREVFDRGGWLELIKGAAHAGFVEGGGDGGVAGFALGRVGVLIRGRRCGGGGDWACRMRNAPKPAHNTEITTRDFSRTMPCIYLDFRMAA